MELKLSKNERKKLLPVLLIVPYGIETNRLTVYMEREVDF